MQAGRDGLTQWSYVGDVCLLLRWGGDEGMVSMAWLFL